MTKAEKQAQRYASDLRKKYEEAQRDGYMPSIWANIENIWLDGYKAANEVRWHDLEENPDDLPSNGFVLDQNGNDVYYSKGRHCWQNRNGIIVEVTAWTEIPQYNPQP